MFKNFYSPIFIMLLILSTNIWSFTKNSGDKNKDGINDTNITENFNSTNIVAIDSNLSIGMIQSGFYTAPRNRLQDIGFNNITLISPFSGEATFSNYTLIYIPIGWADSSFGHSSTILNNNTDYLQYVNDGGNMLVEQPNAYKLPGDSITVTLLPEPVTFHHIFNPADYPPIIVDSLHFITNGLTREEMPIPVDSINTLDAIYDVLVKGQVTDTPSLFVTEYGSGKILVHTSNPSPNATYPMSDSVIVRMINWLSDGIVTSVSDIKTDPPNNFTLKQNYPNPFNPQTLIEYNLIEDSYVKLEIYNSVGQKIKTLVSKTQSSGPHSVIWNGTNELGKILSSGIYYYRLEANEFTLTKKMLFLK